MNSTDDGVRNGVLRPDDDGAAARTQQLVNEMYGIVDQLRENDDNHLENNTRLMARFAEHHQRIDTLAKRFLDGHEPETTSQEAAMPRQDSRPPFFNRARGRSVTVTGLAVVSVGVARWREAAP